jgi:hypothetical protein
LARYIFNKVKKYRVSLVDSLCGFLPAPSFGYRAQQVKKAVKPINGDFMVFVHSSLDLVEREKKQVKN